MDNGRFIEELTLYERLPEPAIREATERRDELLPIFLGEIEANLADEDPIPEMPTALFMIAHGDQRPIRDIIECETANEFIRAEMRAVLATLAYRGKRSKDNVAAYASAR